MFHTSEFGTVSAIDAWMRSPGWIVSEVIWMLGAGISSHHAEYEALPDDETSCSVPAWINVVSPTLQFASTHPPPIPIHDEEYSSWRAVCCVAVGTVQSPVMPLNVVPFSRAPWL